MNSPRHRYTAVAIVLHWAIAFGIAGNVLIGWWMHAAIDAAETRARAIAAFQLHKSVGLTILALSLFRLFWRLLHPPAELPSTMPKWEKLLAKAVHGAFYVLMVAIPLAGWLYVSAQWRADGPLNVPTLWFGLVEIPHLLALNETASGVRMTLSRAFLSAHEVLAWSMVALAALHVVAALKHHFIDRDDVLAGMAPIPPRAGAPIDRGRAAVLAGGCALIVVACSAMTLAFFRTPLIAAPPASEANGERERDAARTAPPRPAGPPADVSRGSPPSAAFTDAPGSWTLAPARGEIAYSGVHAGQPFRGRFTRWTADIRLDPSNLPQSRATVVIDAGSAEDGVALHDKTLPQPEWFDIAHHPTAAFRTTRIHQANGDRFLAEGILTIKGRDLPVDLPFALTIDGERATIAGNLIVNRLDANLGRQSDPNALYVSQKISVEFHVEVERAR